MIGFFLDILDLSLDVNFWRDLYFFWFILCLLFLEILISEINWFLYIRFFCLLSVLHIVKILILIFDDCRFYIGQLLLVIEFIWHWNKLAPLCEGLVWHYIPVNFSVFEVLFFVLLLKGEVGGCTLPVWSIFLHYFICNLWVPQWNHIITHRIATLPMHLVIIVLDFIDQRWVIISLIKRLSNLLRVLRYLNVVLLDFDALIPIRLSSLSINALLVRADEDIISLDWYMTIPRFLKMWLHQFGCCFWNLKGRT